MKTKLTLIALVTISLGVIANAAVVTNGNATLWSTTSTFVAFGGGLYSGQTDDIPFVSGMPQSVIFSITGAGSDTEFIAFVYASPNSAGPFSFTLNSLTGYFETTEPQAIANFSRNEDGPQTWQIQQLNAGAVVNFIGITSVPEPSSVALLGIGGIFLMRRKRNTI